MAAIDALVALTILLISVTLGLRAMETARRAASAANEAAQATRMLRGLLDATTSRQPGVASGQSPRFLWRTETRALTQANGPTGVRPCERSARVINLRSHRRYDLATVFICPSSS